MASVAATIRGVLSLSPQSPALEFRGRWHTWGELDAQVRVIDALLTQAGLGEAARVGILLRNRPPQMAAALASICTQRCLVTLNPVLPDDQLADDVASLQLPVVIGEACDLQRPRVDEALRQVGSTVIQLPASLDGSPQLQASQTPYTVARRDQPGVIIEMLSSGTTGKPKRIPLLARNFEQGFAAGNAYERGRDGDDTPRLRSGTMFLSLPLTHISGLWSVIQTIAGGRKSFLMERFSLEEWRDGVRRHRPKLFSGPPTILRMILDAHLPKEELSSLVAIRTGTAPLDPAIVDEFYARYGIPVLQNYGATEFAGAVTGWTVEDFHRYRESKRGSVGRLQAGVSARVLDVETFEPLPAGAEGVLELQSAQLGDPDRWLRTTDRAVLDADGFLYIKGRTDNAIVRGGFKVHPDDVVQALESHPAIQEASVVGIKDARLGEVPVAALVARPGTIPPEGDELSGWLRSRLTPYQIPVQFRFIDELPRTPSMKVSQPAVRALFGG